MKSGARARLSRLQGRREDECVSCGDEVGLTTCGRCGDVICRDCLFDHACRDEEGKPPSKRARSSIG